MGLFSEINSGRRKLLSEAELGKFTGRGELRRWLRFLSAYDVAIMYHDFLDITVANQGWSVANSGGAGTPVNFVLDTGLGSNGFAIMNGGTDDNASASAIHKIQWLGDRNCGMMTRFTVDTATNYNLEAGLIDAVPGTNGPGVADVDTPTATMTDGALLTIDTDQTLATLACVTAGTSFTTTATTVASPAPTNLTGGTCITLEIQLIGNRAHFWINGVHVAKHNGNKVEGGTKLAPWFYIRNRSAARRIMSVDYCLVWQQRA